MAALGKTREKAVFTARIGKNLGKRFRIEFEALISFAPITIQSSKAASGSIELPNGFYAPFSANTSGDAEKIRDIQSAVGQAIHDTDPDKGRNYTIFGFLPRRQVFKRMWRQVGFLIASHIAWTLNRFNDVRVAPAIFHLIHSAWNSCTNKRHKHLFNPRIILPQLLATDSRCFLDPLFYSLVMDYFICSSLPTLRLGTL